MKTIEKKDQTYTGGEWKEIPAIRAFCSLLLTLDKQIEEELEFWAEYRGGNCWTNETNLLTSLHYVAIELGLPDGTFSPADMIAKIRKENEGALKAEGQALYESVTEDFNRAKGIK